MKASDDKNHQADSTVSPKISNETSTGGHATLIDNRPATVFQRKLMNTMVTSTIQTDLPYQRKANNTGLPDQLKSGIESLSGYAMDDVKVHYNSSKPAQLQAHAYAQGTNIHLAPGQEKHLPHEAWHVVQQKQGRVKPTRQLKSKVNINDDVGLEKEADVMGQKASGGDVDRRYTKMGSVTYPIVQRVIDKEAIDAFIKVLEGQLNQSKIGNRFRFVEFNEVFKDQDPEIKALFLDVMSKRSESTWDMICRMFSDVISVFRSFNLANRNPRSTALFQYMETELNRVFGYGIIEKYIEEVAGEGIDLNRIPFSTNGLKYEDVRDDISPASVINVMRDKILESHGEADEEKMHNLIESGVGLPRVVEVSKGDVFYKIVPPHVKFKESQSAYYLNKSEMEKIVGNTDVAENKLALPLASYSPVYWVYEIEAKVNTIAFESSIARASQVIPHIEQLGKGNSVIFNLGGARQTLIIDNFLEAVWKKGDEPKYIFDPMEPSTNMLLEKNKKFRDAREQYDN